MLNCKEVVARGDQLLAGELGAYQQFRVYLHLAVCVYCRLYLRQLKLLIGSFRHLHKTASADEVNDVMQAVLRNINEPQSPG